MKIFIVSVLFLFTTYSFAQTDTILVNGFKFVTVVKIEKNEFRDKGRDTLIKFYRMEYGKAKYLLTHYLYRFGADCNNEFTDIGTYKIQNDSIIFLTEFSQKTGMDPIPDRQKQIYKVGEGGKLLLIYNKQQDRFSGKWVDAN